jgi:NitT/TauT family transport system substrate-binding protein
VLTRRTRILTAAVAAALLTALGACSRMDRNDSGSNPAAPAADKGPAAELRLGYFPNVTHAAALIGLDKGLFTKALGSTELMPMSFNAGPDEVNALLGGSLDAAFIGTGPTINAFAKSKGEAVRLIAGATSGGAQFVVKPDIGKPEDLVGKTVVTPQLGNTQDISLKKWLNDKGLAGKVQVTNLENAQTLDSFKKGDVQAAWLPEPWSSRLVLEADAKVLLDEKEMWPDGKFPTTVLIVRTEFLRDHPQTVRALLRGLLDAVDYASANKTDAQVAVNTKLKELTGKALSDAVIQRAWSGIELTFDPLSSRFPQLAKDSVTAGISKEETQLAGLVDLSALNTVLQQTGKPEVNASGLDKK